MSERDNRSRFWLWVCIVAIAVFSLKCDYHRFYATHDLQRRVGQLEFQQIRRCVDCP